MFQKIIDLLYKVWPNLALRLWYWANIRRIEKEFQLLEKSRSERVIAAENKLNKLIDEAYDRERIEQSNNDGDNAKVGKG